MGWWKCSLQEYIIKLLESYVELVSYHTLSYEAGRRRAAGFWNYTVTQLVETLTVRFR